MKSLQYHPVHALDHLRAPQPPAGRSVADPAAPVPTYHVRSHRPKSYRIVLHSTDRIAGSPTLATFDLGDLAGAWNLSAQRDNLDAGSKHYNMHLESFYLTCQNATPATVEIHGLGFPAQSESFDSKTGTATELLGVAAGAANAAAASERTGITLRSVPSGRVTIKLSTRDYGDTLQTDMDTDATLRWHLVLCLHAARHAD